MRFDDVWKQLCEKRPALRDPNSTVEIRSDNFKALLRQVYEKGAESTVGVIDSLTDIMKGFR